MKVKKFRCAVYIRKSSEAGLEQEFNSLEAQSESCKAYILSQAGEGWSVLDKVYSDGGISGGHMERPGLKQLIGDIENNRIDIVVVYKVDRLTRSLSDFSKLVDIFDKNDVSFVSVTQAFNTTNSMGRLTLNVLLSFAQFEREVTAERIRDKIAASKKRGKWMGGLPPFGYDNIDKKLVINPREAEQLRYIFGSYVMLKNVADLVADLSAKGFKTKIRSTRKHNQIGGKAFCRGHLYQLLSNPVYIGKVKHKGAVYEGEHEPIIELELWESVQNILRSNGPNRQQNHNIKSRNLLTSLIFDGAGDCLSPVYTKKASGKRYRYYVSQRLMQQVPDDDLALRLPADETERIVLSKLCHALKSQEKHCNTTKELNSLKLIGTSFNSIFQGHNYQDKVNFLRQYINKIVFRPEQIELLLSNSAFVFMESNPSLSFIYPTFLKRRSVETRIIMGNAEALEPDPILIQLISKAHLWWEELKAGVRKSQKAIAIDENIDKGDVSRIIKLAFLSPDIVRDIIHGRQPVELTARSLMKKTSHLPADWELQKPYLGYAT